MFDLQAHRGGAGLTVENTLAAFRRSLEIGVSTLECDVNISADGVPMVTTTGWSARRRAWTRHR